MISKYATWACLFLLATLVGCNSTPYRDDYAKHVNTLKNAPMDANNFHVIFSDNAQVDLRALYDNDTTMGDSSILYQGGAGGAGLIAMVAQIGIHSSIVSSQREERLTSLQDAANSQIQPLLKMVDGFLLSELLTPESESWFNSKTNITTESLYVKPIFFSSTDMSQLSVKVVAWLPDPNGSKKHPDRFKNLYHVVNAPLSDVEQAQLINGDKALLQSVLSDLLDTAMTIVYADTTGKFFDIKGSVKTYKLPKSEGIKVFRATKIADTCEHTIVRNLRQWLIALPKVQPTLASQTNVKSNGSVVTQSNNLLSKNQCTAGV